MVERHTTGLTRRFQGSICYPPQTALEHLPLRLGKFEGQQSLFPLRQYHISKWKEFSSSPFSTLNAPKLTCTHFMQCREFHHMQPRFSNQCSGSGLSLILHNTVEVKHTPVKPEGPQSPFKA
jgi:hypothetical protein